MNKNLEPVLGLLCLLFVSAMVGCADGPFTPESGREKIDFNVLERVVDPGDAIVATLVNRSVREAGYNLCHAELDRRTGSGWQRVQRHPPNSVCTDILNVLAPGESARLTQPVFEEFPAGVYRFRVEVEWPIGGQRFTVATGSFGIEE